MNNPIRKFYEMQEGDTVQPITIDSLRVQLAKAKHERDELKKQNVAIHEKLQQALSRGVKDYEEIERLKELLNQVVRASVETRLQLCGYTEEEQKKKSAEVWEQFKIEKNL